MRTRSLLFLCMASTPYLVSGQTIICDRFDPKAALQASKLTVSLDTDLPDSTQLMVSISRSYWAGTPSQEYPLDYLEARATVGEWRKPRVVNVDHAPWRRKLDDRVGVLAAAGAPHKVARIDSNLTISFTVPINQADPRFGRGNRNLAGKRVSTTGLRVVRARVKVQHPFNAAEQPRPAEFDRPRYLRSGINYRLSRETPLVSERHPADPLRAVALIRSLPAGAIITILSMDRSDVSNPWYHVKAASASGADFGSGWVNSDALIGQEIRLVRP